MKYFNLKKWLNKINVIIWIIKEINTYCPLDGGLASVGWAGLGTVDGADLVNVGITACFQSIPFSTMTAINCPTSTWEPSGTWNDNIN